MFVYQDSIDNLLDIGTTETNLFLFEGIAFVFFSILRNMILEH